MSSGGAVVAVRIEVRCYGEVAQTVGRSELALTPDTEGEVTVEAVLGTLEDSHPEFDVDRFSGGLVAMLNGTHADQKTALSDGDVLALSQSPMRE